MLDFLPVFRRFVLFFLVPFSGEWSHGEIDFAHQVAPILKAKCAKCHMEDKKKGGFSMNTRAAFLEGSENGPVVKPGDGAGSFLVELVTTDDKDILMPPKGERLTPAEVALLKQWIDEKMPWVAGFSFGKQSYEPPLKHRAVKIPVIKHPEVKNDIDRTVAAYLGEHGSDFPPPIDDAAFLRRVYLDLIGLLPPKEILDSFLADKSADKREKAIADLLNNDAEYAAHWLTFWNDLLRNAYKGTGFIDGGRSQITDWIIPALRENLSYDEMIRQLVSPSTSESAGFINGIKWRGDVNASQTREVQFSQNIGQAFLGINMKCASCHDSFVDRWKLDEAYHLAAIFATEPIEIHRCDKATGKFATAAWIFPELGQIDPKADQKARLRQLAELLVHPDNGRTTRTIANRIWHRLLGRGIVHPVDAMDTEPWSEDLLDHLANYLVEQNYDLRKLMAYIASSRTYQSRPVLVEDEASLNDNYTFAGPVARRMTAEQYLDSIEQIGRIDARDNRALPLHISKEEMTKLYNQVRWLELFDLKSAAPEMKKGGYIIRSTFEVSGKQLAAPRIMAQVSTGFPDAVLVNGTKVANLDRGRVIDIKSQLKAGENEIVIQIPAKERPYYIWNAFVTAGEDIVLNTGDPKSWKWKPSGEESTAWAQPTILDPGKHPAAAEIKKIRPGLDDSRGQLLLQLYPESNRARVALRDTDLLQRSLGRPNREQIVSMRENRLTMLQAMDLSNGEEFSRLIAKVADGYLKSVGGSPEEVVTGLFLEAFCRVPSDQEKSLCLAMLGETVRQESLQDFLWNLFMLPEFQIVQ